MGAMASPLLSLPGAVPAAGADAAVAWHYGDPMAEQRAATRTAALIDRSHRDVLTIAGPERLGWLNTITSQELLDLPDGASTEALVLSPQGHVEHHFVLTELAGVVHIDTEPDRGVALRAYLEMMVFWSKVEIAGTTRVSLFWRCRTAGACPAGRRARRGQRRPGGRCRAAAPGGGFVRQHDDGWELLVPRARLAEVATTLVAAGATPGGQMGRRRAAHPHPPAAMGRGHRRPHHSRTRCSWLTTAVHLEKGCYRGQETVARVHNLGRPPRGS